MDNTKKFTDKADKYVSSRPSYPTKLMDYLYNEVGFSDKSKIADIGAGTGIFTRQLLERNSDVIAVEPNDDMRAKLIGLQEEFKNLKVLSGTAENTLLENKSIDFVTVAQAFHWFDAEKFKTECRRVLKKDGKAVLVWNNRDEESDIVKGNVEIFKKYCKNFTCLSGSRLKNYDGFGKFFEGEYKLLRFENNLQFDREKFVGRSLSASYSLTANDEKFDEYVKELNELFDKYEKNGIATVPNYTEVYIGEV